MTHQVSLQLPDSVYAPLAEMAKREGRTVEEIAQSQLEASVQRDGPGSRLRKWAGAADSGLTDVSARHHEYLGEAQRDHSSGDTAHGPIH